MSKGSTGTRARSRRTNAMIPPPLTEDINQQCMPQLEASVAEEKQLLHTECAKLESRLVRLPTSAQESQVSKLCNAIRRVIISFNRSLD